MLYMISKTGEKGDTLPFSPNFDIIYFTYIKYVVYIYGNIFSIQNRENDVKTSINSADLWHSNMCDIRDDTRRRYKIVFYKN